MPTQKKRKCAWCQTPFDPTTTENPANRARKIHCSDRCKNARWRHANREKVREINRVTAAKWYEKLSPAKKKTHIKKITLARQTKNQNKP